MMSCGWLWLYASAFLMLLELALPGFVVFFFGLSAGTVGILRFVLGPVFDLTWQLAAFSFFAITYIFVLRRWMKNTFFGTRADAAIGFTDGNVGRAGKVTEAITPPLTGRVEIGDAQWEAEADAPIAAGAIIKVISQHNLTMKVEEIK